MNQTITNTETIFEIWDTIVRKIGGQHIKTLSMSATQFNNFADPNMITTVFSDAILLKNSTNIIFCTLNLFERNTIWGNPLEDIERLFYFSDRPEKHIILLKCNTDGLYWVFRIETQ